MKKFSTLTRSRLVVITSLLIVSGIAAAMHAIRGTEAQVLTPSVSLLVPTGVNNGDTVDIQVMANNVADLGAYEFTLDYDPSIITVNSAANGPFLASTGRTVSPLAPVIDNTAGTVTVAAFSLGATPAGPEGSGQIATIQVTAQADGVSALDLTSVSLLTTTNADLGATPEDSEITIGSEGPTATPSPTPDPTTAPSPSPSPEPSPEAGSPASLTFGGPTSGVMDETVDVTVDLDTGGASVVGTDVVVTFDPARVQIDNVSLGTDFDTFPALSTDNVQGSVVFSGVMNPETSFSGTSTLATLTVSPVVPGAATLRFDYTNGSSTDSNVIDATSGADILGSVGSHVVTFVQTAEGIVQLTTPNEDPETGFAIAGILTATESTFSANLNTDTSGSSLPVSLESGFIGQIKGFFFKASGYLRERVDTLVSAGTNVLDFGLLRAGDLNDDGIINTVDLALMYESWFQPGVSDFNGDGTTNSADYWHLTQHYFAENE